VIHGHWVLRIDFTISICFSHQTAVHFKLVESTDAPQDILTKTHGM
jgi:hypothetical protein